MKKNYSIIYGSLLIFVLCSISVKAQTKIIPYQQLPPINSNMFFGASMTTNSITVTFEGPADRWFALGFGAQMAPTDVLMYGCGISASIVPVGWYDYFNNFLTATVVDIDPIQNWNIVSTGTLTNGNRTVTATRALNTGDVNYDVVLSYAAPTINLVWARGATSDYTIAYHGVGNRADGIVLPWLSTPTASFAALTTTVCQGSAVTFTNLTTGGLTAYNWTFQSGFPSVSTVTNPSITYTIPGTYSVALTATNVLGTSTASYVNYIVVTPTVATSISIAQSSGTNPMCFGSPATFTASSTNGGTSPAYQWRINGVNAGSGQTFNNPFLANLSVITCVMTSNASCPSPVSVTSTPITMTVNSTSPANITVSQISGGNPICNGATASFNANQANGGTSPSYQWQINGSNVGTNSPNFSTNLLTNGAVVTCILTSNAPCASATMATSSGITMTVSSILAPAVSIALVGPGNPFCAGDPVTLTATAVNGGNTPNYQWLVNGLIAATGATFAATNLNNGAVVSCVLLSNLSCSSPNTATSSPVTITVNPIPVTPTITASGSTTFCAGGSVLLSSSAPAGNIWSTGATSATMIVTTAGTLAVTQTQNGCVSALSQSVSITVNPLPVVTMQTVSAMCLSAPVTPLPQGAPAGGIYSGIGVAGNSFFPGNSGPGNFTVVYSYTNANTCSNSASITVDVEECLSVKEKFTDHSGITIYPVPTSGLLTISSVKEKMLSVKITDLGGRVIFKQNCNNETALVLDISKEVTGVYVIDVVLKSGTFHRKISKRD